MRTVVLLLVSMSCACADDPPATRCETLAPGSCDAAAQCSELRAARLEVDAGCAHAPEPVGCIADHTVCGAAFRFAEAPDAAVYRFRSTCTPRAFRAISFDDRAASWPSCAR